MLTQPRFKGNGEHGETITNKIHFQLCQIAKEIHGFPGVWGCVTLSGEKEKQKGERKGEKSGGRRETKTNRYTVTGVKGTEP